MKEQDPATFNVYRTPGRARRKLGLIGCIAAPILLVSVTLAAIFVIVPALRPNALRGDFLSAVAVPGPGGGSLLWILSNGSIHYIKRVETPGRLSIARRCVSCKTWLYVYDPVRKKILSRFRTDYQALIISSWMVLANGKIWVVTGPYDKNEPRLFIYNPEPAALLRETADIIKDHPELNSGLIGVRMEKDPARLILDTRDGRTGLVLSLGDEQLFPGAAEFKAAFAPESDETTTMFALGQDGSGPRYLLYRLTGPKNILLERNYEHFLRNLKTPAIWPNVAAEPAAPGRVFIEGVIFHQDADSCLILHQDAAGKTADRLLTCLDRNGREKWTAPREALFKEMRVDTDEVPLSAIFFMKDDIGVSRSGDLILLQLKGIGAIGFDFQTGKKLWEVKF